MLPRKSSKKFNAVARALTTAAAVSRHRAGGEWKKLFYRKNPELRKEKFFFSQSSKSVRSQHRTKKFQSISTRYFLTQKSIIINWRAIGKQHKKFCFRKLELFMFHSFVFEEKIIPRVIAPREKALKNLSSGA